MAYVCYSHKKIITVCGIFTLCVVQGSVSILGATLTASIPQMAYPVYAPQSHSLPVITGLKRKRSKHTEAIIHLKNYSPGIERFALICPFTEMLFNAPTNSIFMSPNAPTFHVLL